MFPLLPLDEDPPPPELCACAVESESTHSPLTLMFLASTVTGTGNVEWNHCPRHDSGNSQSGIIKKEIITIIMEAFFGRK